MCKQRWLKQQQPGLSVLKRPHVSGCNNALSPLLPSAQSGFTLIELMVTVAIIAILATIAIPSYRTQIRENAEHQAKQRALSVANELSSWRSKRLSYAGFIPRNVCADGTDFCYSDATKEVYVPLGSNTDTRKYTITLVDAQPVVTGAAPNTVTTGVPLTPATAGGKGWRMLVKPNTNNSIVATAHSYYLDSLGQKCQYTSAAQLPVLTAATITCTGAGVTTW